MFLGSPKKAAFALAVRRGFPGRQALQGIAYLYEKNDDLTLPSKKVRW